MWKKILWGLIAFIAIAVTLVMFMTSGMTESAEAFFSHTKSGNYNKAYQMLSADFKRSTSQEQLVAFLKQTGLDGYQSASWGNRSFEGKQGKLEGSIETASGAIPVVVKFIKTDSGSWQIYSIYKPKSGVKIEEEEKPVQETQKPDRSLALSLTEKTINTFSAGIKAKDMNNFYDSIAKVWQRQTTVSALETAFKSYIDQDIDLTVLQTLKPVLESEPIIDEQGVLKFKGYYPSKPKRFHFELGYYKEDGVWKLIDIDAKIR